MCFWFPVDSSEVYKLLFWQASISIYQKFIGAGWTIDDGTVNPMKQLFFWRQGLDGWIVVAHCMQLNMFA